MSKRPLLAFSILTAVATLALLGVGGLVTSRGHGLAVPDWPTTNGYNMFFFPVSQWIGGVFYEHSHRLVASLVGLLTVGLTRWLGGYVSRRPLLIIAAVELAAGLLMGFAWPNLKGTGHFLLGIGGVVLLAGLLPVRNAPAAGPLPLLGWIAFWAVQLQGLLGGLRVVLLQDQIGVFHATLAQLFFTLLCVIVLLLSPVFERLTAIPVKCGGQLLRLSAVAAGLIFLQLILGAAMRHQHAGLAIPDFPLAYGRIWPDTSPEAIASYNRQRIEVTAARDITATQVNLQMFHRLTAFCILGILAALAAAAVRRAGLRSPVPRLCLAWLGLVLVQASLGAFTVWSNKAADIATAHLLFGAMSLALGAIVCIVLFCSLAQVGGQFHRDSVPRGTRLGNPSMAEG